MGQWDKDLKGRVNLVTDQHKKTQSVVGLWDTLLKEKLLYRAEPIRFVGPWDTVLKGRVNLVTSQYMCCGTVGHSLKRDASVPS